MTAVGCLSPRPYPDNIDALFRSDRARIVPAAGRMPAYLLLERAGRVTGAYARVTTVRDGYTRRTVLISVRPTGTGAGAGASGPVVGRLTLGADGCVGLDGHTAVFPPGTTWGPRLNRLVLPDGTLAVPGDTVTGVGAVLPAEAARQAVSGSTERRSCTWSDQVRVLTPGSGLAVGP